MDQSRKTLFVITGMHRSGTSLLMRGMQALGVDLGDDLLGAAAENPTGYWEDRTILDLSRAVLRVLGRRWNSVAPLADAEFENPALQPIAETAAAYLRARPDGWGFKNPRTGPLLPFWQRVFEMIHVDVKYVISVRSPTSVARSLGQREARMPGFCYAVWTSHYLDTLRHLDGAPVVFVAYETLLKVPVSELQRVADRLGLKASGAVQAFADDFISPALNHHPQSNETDAAWLPETRDLYRALLKLCGDMAEPSKVTDPIRLSWDSHRDYFAALDAQISLYEEQQEEQDAAPPGKDAQIAQLKAERDTLSAIIEGYETSVAGLLGSARWRLGNAIGGVKQRAFRQMDAPLVTENFRDLAAQYRRWKNRP